MASFCMEPLDKGVGGEREAARRHPSRGRWPCPPQTAGWRLGENRGTFPVGGGGGVPAMLLPPLPPQPVHREGLCHRVLLPRALLAPHAVPPAETVGKRCPGGLVNPESTHLPPAQG